MFEMSFRSGKNGARSTFKEEYIRDDYKKINIKAEIGSMFMEFLSLTGDIENSNHPFIQVAGDTCEGITENSAFLVELREYIDLGISTPAFFEESCFMFFLNIRGLRIPAIHQQLIPLKGHENDAVENYIEYNKNMSPLERAMRGYVAAGNEIYDLPLTTYECETVEDACIASLHFLITRSYNIRKCENCGKYFIPLRSDAIYCDRISPFDKRRTCKTDGALRKHYQTSEEDIVIVEAKRIKRNRSQQSRRNPSNQALQIEFAEWDTTFRKMQKDYKKGAITADQFLKWLSEHEKFKG